MTLLTFWNLIAWSVQAGVLVAAALLMLKVVRLDPPAVRYLLLRVVLVVCLLLPLVQPYRPASMVDADSRLVPAAATGSSWLSSERAWPGAAEAEWGTVVFFERWGWIAFPIIAIGVVARLGWVGIGLVRVRALRDAGYAAAPDAMSDELQCLIGTRAAIRFVSGLEQPMMVGFRRPVVLLPESLKGDSLDIQRAVLAHELWHVRRRDWIWTVLEETVRALCWFHPGVWILLSSIQSTREELVDELAILTTGSRRSYVDALLAYAERPAPFAATALARRSHLLQRVILISKEAVMSSRRVVGSSAVILAVLVTAAWSSGRAFPLAAQSVGGSTSAGGQGPVEQRAKPITPENPIPRRIYYVPPDYPAVLEAEGISGTVTVRIVLDETGQIAETRVTGVSLGGTRLARVTVTDSSGVSVEAGERAASRLSGGAQSASFSTAWKSATDAVLRAVRQWQYAPPAEGPIAFPVAVPIGPERVGRMPPPPPPPPPAPGTAGWQIGDGAVRVGGQIKPPVKLRHVNPNYPPDALSQRVQGVVIIEARIEADGQISQARVLRSIPMLDEAALEAVTQWQFAPTLINGQPTPVVMTVTVNFVLD